MNLRSILRLTTYLATALVLLVNADIITGWWFYGCDYARTLLYYRYIESNDAKLEAAKFLMENAKYHHSTGMLGTHNYEAEQIRMKADSIYAAITSNGTYSELYRDSLHYAQQQMRKHYESTGYPSLEVKQIQYVNEDILTFEFLTEHIDNAFQVWRSSKFARGLKFRDFKELILPYCSVEGVGFHETGRKYNETFGKYIKSDATSDIVQAVSNYNTTIGTMRSFELFKPREHLAGFYDLYSNGLHDCVEIASYGCNIMRACGLPVMVEFNTCYTDLIGRHYHCRIYDYPLDAYKTFNPESSLPGNRDWAFNRTMNVYRMTYAPQKDTPFFLHNEDEYIPPILRSPCIEDVTIKIRDTAPLTLPFTPQTKNRLAYLATFNRDEMGMLPVTWGIINSKANNVTFNYVIPDAIYFPIYYKGDSCVSFAKPFYVKITDDYPDYKAILHEIPGIDGNQEYADITLTRKYPRKKNMITVAENLVGGRFLGANKEDFSDAVVLYEITEAPQPYFLESAFKKTGKFRFYRFQAPAAHPQANISMLEWLTDKDYAYENTAPATRPHILRPEDVDTYDTTKIQLLDAPLGSSTWKSEYDGNMLTAPGAYPNITLRLQEKQIVTGVRFAPLNANNGINNEDVYELYYWENGWKRHSKTKATYEYLTFKHVPQNRMYWLKNCSKGQEETPFVIINGKQQFVYKDIIGWEH